MPSGRTEVPSTARADAVTDYIEQVRRLLKSRHCIANSFTPVDEKLAIALFERGFRSNRSIMGYCWDAHEDTSLY